MRRALALLAVVLATLVSATAALAVFTVDKELSVGKIRLSVAPFHAGSLDIYVPLVDWGVRFDAVRMPARLEIDVRALDRRVLTRVAAGEPVDVELVRTEARDAVAAYLRVAILAMIAAGLGAGALVALAVRHHHAPRVRVMLAAAGAAALAAAAVTALTLPPRGELDRPEYFAFGPDIPRALDALESVRRSQTTLDEELNSQLVGLARLVVAPAERRPIEDSHRLTVTSDLHNNFLFLPILERAARGGPVFFAGDLTDRGSGLETRFVRRAVQSGSPFVFVSGNHDSDALIRELVRDGAIVLTQEGRLNRDGSRGPVVNRIAGLRVAGYADPFERRERDDFADRYEPAPGRARQVAFADWLRGLIGEVDVVMVHDPVLAELALEELAVDPPPEPLLVLTGHTHEAALRRLGTVTVLNGGSIGAGGSGNLAEAGTKRVALATLAYGTRPFEPLAADLVSIDAETGSSSARRERLDEPPG